MGHLSSHQHAIKYVLFSSFSRSVRHFLISFLKIKIIFSEITTLTLIHLSSLVIFVWFFFCFLFVFLLSLFASSVLQSKGIQLQIKTRSNLDLQRGREFGVSRLQHVRWHLQLGLDLRKLRQKEHRRRCRHLLLRHAVSKTNNHGLHLVHRQR